MTVYVHCAAGEGYTAIIVESRIAVYGNSTSGDDDIAVGIDAIGIACAHRDCDCATRNFYSWCVLGGLVRSVDSIIRSLNRNITAADKDIGRFDPFKGRNIHRSVGDFNHPICVNPVIPALERKLTSTDSEGTICVDCIIKSIDLIGTAIDYYRNTGFNALEGFCRISASRIAAAAGRDIDCGILCDKGCLGLNTILPRDNRDGRIHDRNKPLVRVCSALRPDAVTAGGDADSSVRELDGDLSIQTDICSVYGQILCCDNKIVFGDNRVLIITVDDQFACTVDCEIISAEYRCVQGGIIIDK